MSERRRTYTRRDILRFGIFAAGALIAEDTIVAHTESDSLTRSFWETLETGTQDQDPELLRTELEQKYGIRILRGNVNEIAQKFSISPTAARNLRTTLDWPAPQLKTLDFALSSLPNHFHEPVVQANRTRPLGFALVDTLSRYSSAISSWDYYEEDIQLEQLHLASTIFEKKSATKTVAHEITHLLTGAAQFKRFEEYWKDELGLAQIADLRLMFHPVITEYKPSHPLYPFRLITWKEHIGYGASNMGEFWSVAAENYLDGEANFVQEYKRFMGDQRAKLLYESVKSGIFRGWEYKQGSPINFSGPFKS